MTRDEAIFGILFLLWLCGIGVLFWFAPHVSLTVLAIVGAFIVGLKFIDKAIRSH